MGFNRAIFNIALTRSSDDFIKLKYEQVEAVIINELENRDKDVATSEYLINLDEIIDEMLLYIGKGEDRHIEIDSRIKNHPKIIFSTIEEAKSLLLTIHIIYVCVKIYRVVNFRDNIDYDVITMYKKTGVNLDLNLNQASNDDGTYLGYTVEDINNRIDLLFDETRPGTFSPDTFNRVKKYIKKYILNGDQKNKEKIIGEYNNIKKVFFKYTNILLTDFWTIKILSHISKSAKRSNLDAVSFVSLTPSKKAIMNRSFEENTASFILFDLNIIIGLLYATIMFEIVDERLRRDILSISPDILDDFYVMGLHSSLSRELVDLFIDNSGININLEKLIFKKFEEVCNDLLADKELLDNNSDDNRLQDDFSEKDAIKMPWESDN